MDGLQFEINGLTVQGPVQLSGYCFGETPVVEGVDIPADQFTDSYEYALVSYVKTALWMYILEASLGREQVDQAVQHYFRKWKHKHPQPADMKTAFEESLGQNLDGFFRLTQVEGRFQLGD